ncbi:EAL domain-containing protein [Sulfurimonas sp.]|nr:EAL domain-containing protein [Sulfurimonas sp.]
MSDIIKFSKTLKLLYVEDHREARDAMLQVLNEFFDDITIAFDGEDGLDKFQSNKIDLIITDVNMPKMDGLLMVEKIRSTTTTNTKIPVIVLSAFNETDYFLQSIRIGVEGYLLKPIELAQFMNILNKVVSRLMLVEESRKNENILKQYKEITDKSSIVSIIGVDGKIKYANDAFYAMSEYTKEEVIGTPYNSIENYSGGKVVGETIFNTLLVQKEIWQGILQFTSKNGKVNYLKTTIKPITDKENSIVEFIVLRDNITEIMNPKKQLLDAIKNLKEPVVVYIKIEEFHTIEEFYDHETVEKIQDKTKKYLQDAIKGYCNISKVYKLGNGEYAMTSEKALCMPQKKAFISKLKEFQALTRNNKVNIGVVDYDISIIISVAFENDNIFQSAKLGINELLKSKQNFIIANDYARKEHDKAEKNMQTISMVKEAIDNNRIVSYYQAIIDNKTQKAVKYESLVRLIKDDGEVLSPYFFLDVAKRGKYYSQITDIVLINSFNALKYTDTDISINLSAIDIEKESTRVTIFNLLSQNSEKSHRVVFELLEDESVKNMQTMKEFIRDVKKFGVKIAIDDFGTGYSNFERLLDYQPDILKIDGSLVKNIVTDPYSLNVLETIITFAKKEKLQVIAEFVENEEIFNIINALGIDFSQGYYFAKPEPLESISK